jgi:hypothetical protein
MSVALYTDIAAGQVWRKLAGGRGLCRVLRLREDHFHGTGVSLEDQGGHVHFLNCVELRAGYEPAPGLAFVRVRRVDGMYRQHADLFRRMDLERDAMIQANDAYRSPFLARRYL